jgi:predicted metal-binding membrane protein
VTNLVWVAALSIFVLVEKIGRAPVYSSAGWQASRWSRPTLSS